jgi:membrane protease YdiL (CAAX protease family)
LIGLGVALFGLAAFSFLPLDDVYLKFGSYHAAVAASLVISWLFCILVVVILIYGERADLGAVFPVRPTLRSFLFGCLTAFGLYAVLAAFVLLALPSALSGDGEATKDLISQPLALRIFTGVTAGATEEFLFRAYAMERARIFIKNRWLAALLVIVAFGLAHVPFWGWAGAVKPTLMGLAFTLLYMWRRNYALNAGAHMGMDLIALIGLPLLMGMSAQT